MTERRLRWCNFEVNEGPEGIYFQENGTWKDQSGVTSHTSRRFLKSPYFMRFLILGFLISFFQKLDKISVFRS